MLTLNDLICSISKYGVGIIDIEKVKKAYHFAEVLHNGQFRDSGEPYIIHPLHVSYILSEMHADTDTICAGLLHDTLEDTSVSEEEIEKEFGKDVLTLVDGVTKISKLNSVSKEETNFANTRKIIVGITSDVRIIIIKLADRLHNMRTLQFKRKFKQKENALETMEIFAPLAFHIGAYAIKNELEDLSLKYLKPDAYKRVVEIRRQSEEDSKPCLQEMLQTIHLLLSDNSISNEVKVRIKHIYGIYKTLSSGGKISDIHDLLALQVIVDEVKNCYFSLGLIHSKYLPINNKFKDYICNPKTNMYQSLHTTVFGLDERLVQAQIRTSDMDKIATYGLPIYWEINKGNSRIRMQETIREKYHFLSSLDEINSDFSSNKAFVNQIKAELFSDRIYVYTMGGQVIDLPVDATPVDFAYSIHTEVGNSIIGAKVNEEEVPITSCLHNNDRVTVITDPSSVGPDIGWLSCVKTSKAKRYIKEFYKFGGKGYYGKQNKM